MKVVLVGATSAIVHSLGRLFASDGATIVLVARNEEKLQVVKEDLEARGAHCLEPIICDFADEGAVEKCAQELMTACEKIDVLFVGHGVLPDQTKAGSEYEQFAKQFQVNCLSVCALLLALKDTFIKQGSGTIAVISSVAGDRGRKSNYAYGAAKGALSIFLAGLRNELHELGVQVLTVKPGFVDTPMTADLPKGALFAQPEKIASDIHRAVKKKKDVLYTPWFWLGIMSIIRTIPEKIFKRLSL